MEGNKKLEGLAEKTEEAAAEAVEEVKETAEAAAEKAEEAVEEVKEAAEETAEKAEEAVEEVKEAAEKAEEAVEEAAEAAEEAEETAEEASEEVKEEAAEEKTETKEPEKKKGSAVKEPPIIKKKKKLDKTNIIVIVVCAVIVVACLVFVGIKSGWFTPKATAKIELGDYSEIEVVKSEVEVTDDTVEQYITNILQSQSHTEEETEGIVADGDQLNINYVGKLDETGEIFDGGSAENRSLTIGSGTMVDGFESGLIGAKIGETTTIHVIFPEDYGNTALAGKAATFDVTINSRSKTVVPELTDEFVHEYSHNYLEKELATVEELEEYVYDYIYNYYLHSAMFEDLKTKETVQSYDADMEEKLMQYSKDSLDYYAGMYGTSADEYAVMYGYSNAEEYAREEAHYYLDTIMLVDKIIKDKNITWTEDEFNQAIALYMARNGYSEKYTIDEFKEQSGDIWLYLFENLEFKFDLAMEALEPNVVFVEQKSGTEESSSETVTEEAVTEEASE